MSENKDNITPSRPKMGVINSSNLSKTWSVSAALLRDQLSAAVAKAKADEPPAAAAAAKALHIASTLDPQDLAEFAILTGQVRASSQSISALIAREPHLGLAVATRARDAKLTRLDEQIGALNQTRDRLTRPGPR